MVGAGILVPDEQLEEEVRRIGHLPERVETAAPRDVQPGENGPQENPTEEQSTGGNSESKSVYKITSIVEKYQRGSITRDTAANLMESLGIDKQQIDFYLSEADKGKKEKEAAVSPRRARKWGRKEKVDPTPTDDEKDEAEALEAKKSLHRIP